MNCSNATAFPVTWATVMHQAPPFSNSWVMSMLKTGKPIFYTSADGVFQIACHEESFGLQRLYDLCAIARELVDEYHIVTIHLHTGNAT